MTATGGEQVTDTLDYDGGRQVTVYIPPNPAESIVYAADGQWHIARLSEALQRADLRSTMIVGVHGLEGDDRGHEYVNVPEANRFKAHEQFFVHDVRRWVESRFAVAVPPERTAVWGASFGGELALAMGVLHPDVYGAVFCASPGGGYRPPEVLPSPLPRFYLVGGDQERGWFLDFAIRWADALRDAGVDVVMMEREGPHGGDFWFEEFPRMVGWAFES
jgi:enterochelin esterase-like enzyme